MESEAQTGLEMRLVALETKVHSHEVRLAVAESTIEEFGRKLDRINSGVSKILWTLGAVIAVAVLNLILKGGVTL